jgi:multiple sugar transport system substrate-binding protein
MRRVGFGLSCVVLLLSLLSLLSACGGGGGKAALTKSAPTKSAVSPQHPVTLTVWVGWSGDDLASLKSIVAGFEKAHPGLTVDLVGEQSDTAKVLAAINSGTAPDLTSAGGGADLGKFCSTGAYIDLGPRLTRDKVDQDIFPPAAQKGTTFNGVHCALPYLADDIGLYYNKSLLAKAKLSSPPRTLSELTQMVKALTEFNADGSIKVAGFVPTVDFYENYIVSLAPMVGAPWFTPAGKASMTDPRWLELFTWQKSLVDFFGYDKLTKFAATVGDEFSASNGFETGKIAMQLDGEWRTGLLAKEHPEVDYGTAPVPVGDDHPELYGSSEVVPGILAIPRGAKNPDLAWELAKYLALDTDRVVQYANALHNVPTTNASLASRNLNLGPNFGPFLQAFSNPKSSFATPIRQGPVNFDPITNFAERWQTGKVPDLQAELRKLNDQIDNLVAQG